MSRKRTRCRAANEMTLAAYATGWLAVLAIAAAGLAVKANKRVTERLNVADDAVKRPVSAIRRALDRYGR